MIRKAAWFGMICLTLCVGLSFGARQPYVAKYLGNPRLPVVDKMTWPGHGLGPASFPGTAVFLDSSANQFWLLVPRALRISSNGANVVGIVLRQMVPSTTWIELFTSTDTGVSWMIDHNFMQARNAHIDFTAPDGNGFLTGVDWQGGQPWYIRNSGGYGSGIWDSQVQIRPSGESYQNARGIWLGNPFFGNICCPMEATSGSIPLMSEVIDTLGNIVSPLQTVFDQNGGTQDYRNGKIVCFGGGPTDGMNIKFSTEGGVTWVGDSMTIYAGSADSGWYDYENVVRQDGSTGVVLTMDDTRHTYGGVHSAIQLFIKGNPNKVTIFSPSMTQAAFFPTIARKDDNTLVVIFSYAPVWDSVSWSHGRTFWDIGESHSTDGGLSWSPVRNITQTDSVSECCPQAARYIGPNNRLHITYGTSWQRDTVDLYWDAMFGLGGMKTYNWYLRDSVALGVEEQKSEGQKVTDYELGPVAPNPMRGTGTIAYQLPKSGHTSLLVYNSLGQRVRTLVDRFEPAGRFTVIWDGRDDCGKPVGAGIYFARFAAENVNTTQRITVLR